VVSLAAGQMGIRVGMTIAEAQARCATLDVRPWDARVISAGILEVTTALLAASPQVTPLHGAPGVWWVGASGFTALGGERALAEGLLAIAQRWHPAARVAIADSCVAARAATWTSPPPSTEPSGITVIPAGHCAAYLALAPLGLVPMPEELRAALTALGMRTVGALAALAPGDVEQRWGREGLTAWRLARGEDPRRPGLVRGEAVRQTSVELPSPVESTGPLLFVMRAQLERLVRALVEEGRSAAAVAITLVLDAGRQWPVETDPADGEASGHWSEGSLARSARPTAEALLGVPQRTITREVRPARPLARLEPLFEQCRSLLERWTIPAPIIGVTITIPATAPLAADQGDLLMPSWRDAAINAEAVVARLHAVLDPDARGDIVVRPMAADSHRPEASGRWAPVDLMAQGGAPLPETPQGTGADAAAPAVLRLLEVPDPVEVETPHGAPEAVWWRGRRLTITQAEGPERLSGDWWRPETFARDYWRCDAADDGTVLLYRDPTAWYLQGWYD
jgi:protein ImuB